MDAPKDGAAAVLAQGNVYVKDAFNIFHESDECNSKETFEQLGTFLAVREGEFAQSQKNLSPAHDENFIYCYVDSSNALMDTCD
ncbi:unnamed protein product [Anisakis simplex]|uniref:COesterase domain-containing protein n=1 Tax=Anisakis simplex TaxID=6269 RepID=A0A0M3JMK9_ANISI|nr:unnamed protein product [Anisakis simplex]